MLSYTCPNTLSHTDLLDRFALFIRLSCANGNASTDTVKTYASSVKQFFQWCHSHSVHPLDAKREDLTLYRRWLIEEQQYKCATISLKLTVVRRFYAAAVELGLIVVNPAISLKPPRESIDPAERINYLEKEEVEQLMASLPTDLTLAALRDRLIVGIMVLEGCRTVEMHRACIGDVVKRGSDLGIRVSGKRSRRIVPLTPDLAKLLNKYLLALKHSGEELLPDTPLFIALDRRTYGGRLSRRSFARVIDKYLRATGLKDKKTSHRKHKSEKKKQKQSYQPPKRSLSAHSLRHTAGTLAIRAGSDLRQVQDLLGHADPRTTALYAHIADRWRNNPALLLGITI